MDAWEELQVALHVPLHVPTFTVSCAHMYRFTRSPCEMHAQSMGVLGVQCQRCRSTQDHRSRSQSNRFLLASPPTAATSDAPSSTWRIEAVVFEALLHQLGVAPHLHVPKQTGRKLLSGAAELKCEALWMHADQSKQVHGRA